MKMKRKRGTFTGTVSLMDISGIGPNSAQILLTLKKDKESRPFIINAYPGHEPAAFAAYASVLSAAYTTDAQVTVRYEIVPDKTDHVAGLSIKK